jgi:hypothetical protein
MTPSNYGGNSKKIIGIGIVLALLGAGAVGLKLWRKPAGSVDQKISPKIIVPIAPQSVIDYNKLDKDQKLADLMQNRKAKYGLEKGIDIITQSDESLKVGNTTVPMQEILDKIRLKAGDIIEKDIQSFQGDSGGKIKEFGIYVVQPGDNIWNIHFKFLKDYFDHKGVALSPIADEPEQGGRSSGVGKILKFSENTVQIYNIKKRELTIDLDMIAPLSKIVVYNMEQIFALLDLIDYEQVNRIQFDGETLWIPAE